MGAKLGRVGFYLVFAIAVTASVQLVGVYLVFASLIIPSLATRNFATARRLPFAYATGVAGYAAGLLLSSVFDLPSGALIVWCLAVIGGCIYGLGPREQTSAAPAHAAGDARLSAIRAEERR